MAGTAHIKNPDTSPETDALSPAAQKEYVLRCIVKQCAVDEETAAQRVAELTKAQIAEIREAGRLGQVRVVQDLLLTAFAKPAGKSRRGAAQTGTGNESQNAD